MTITIERLQELIEQDVTLHRMNDDELIQQVLPSLETLDQQLRAQLLSL